MTLTPEQKAEYVKNRPGHCLFCGSDEIEGESIDFYGEPYTQRIDCLNCEKAWNDVYKLTDIQEINEAEEAAINCTKNEEPPQTTNTAGLT